MGFGRTGFGRDQIHPEEAAMDSGELLWVEVFDDRIAFGQVLSENRRISQFDEPDVCEAALAEMVMTHIAMEKL